MGQIIFMHFLKPTFFENCPDKIPWETSGVLPGQKVAHGVFIWAALWF